jgi:hypothetical protein
MASVQALPGWRGLILPAQRRCNRFRGWARDFGADLGAGVNPRQLTRLLLSSIIATAGVLVQLNPIEAREVYQNLTAIHTRLKNFSDVNFFCLRFISK